MEPRKQYCNTDYGMNEFYAEKSTAMTKWTFLCSHLSVKAEKKNFPLSISISENKQNKEGGQGETHLRHPKKEQQVQAFYRACCTLKASRQQECCAAAHDTVPGT